MSEQKWTIDRQEMIDALSDARIELVADGKPVGSVEELADLVLAQFFVPVLSRNRRER
jgi:hypothetical protein